MRAGIYAINKTNIYQLICLLIFNGGLSVNVIVYSACAYVLTALISFLVIAVVVVLNKFLMNLTQKGE